MMAGGGGGTRCRWRTGPSHSRARPPPRSSCSPCATAASISTPRSAPAAIAARSSLPRTAASSASIATSSAIARGADLVASAGGRLTLVEDTFLRIWRRCARLRLRRRRRRRARSRRLLDAARPGRARLLLPPTTVRSTCAWAARGRAPPTSWRGLGTRSRRPSSVDARRRAPRARRRPRHRRGPRRCADPHHARACRHRRHASCMRGPATSIRRRARSRRCAFSSTRSLSNWPSGWSRPSSVLRPGGRLVVVSFHSLEDRIVKSFFNARGRRSAPVRATLRTRSKPPPTFRAADPAADHVPDEARSPPIRARVRPSCAPPNAPSAPAGDPGLDVLVPRCRRRRRDRERPMMLRLLNICVIVALVAAAGRRLQDQVRVDAAGRTRRQAAASRSRRERDAIAALRAEWAQARQPGAHSDSGAAAPSPQAGRSDADRQLDNLPARPVRSRAAGDRRSDRRHYQEPRGPANSEVSTGSRPAACAAAKSDVRMRPQRDQVAHPRRRCQATLAPTAGAYAALRPQRRPHRKARARIGLAIVAFACRLFDHCRCGSCCSPRLPDSHLVRRAGGQDAVATARPDILDRNGEILATDVRSPSLFGEPHAHHRRGRGNRTAHRRPARPRRRGVRERLASKRRFRRGSSARSRRSSGRKFTGSAFPASDSCPRTSASIPTAPRFPTSSATSTSTTRASPASRSGSIRAASPTCTCAGFATDRLQKPIELAVDLRVQHALRDELIAAREQIQGDGGRGHAVRRAHRRGHLDGFGARLRSQQSARGERPDPHQPAYHRRLRDGSTFKALTLAMALDSGKSRSTRSFDARGRCATAVHHPRLPRAARVLTVPEIFTYSSNIGTARMALALGVPYHKCVPQEDGSARPAAHRTCRKAPSRLVPKRWGELNTVTIAFGHGLSVAPLQAVMGSTRW